MTYMGCPILVGCATCLCAATKVFRFQSAGFSRKAVAFPRNLWQNTGTQKTVTWAQNEHLDTPGGECRDRRCNRGHHAVQHSRSPQDLAQSPARKKSEACNCESGDGQIHR